LLIVDFLLFLITAAKNNIDCEFCLSISHRVFFLVPHTRIEHKMIIIISVMPRIFRIRGAFTGSNAIRPYTKPINGKRIPKTREYFFPRINKVPITK
jgi:hypothetical protein